MKTLLARLHRTRFKELVLMRAVLQRVSFGKVTVENQVVASIDKV